MTDIEGSTELLRRLGKGPYEELLDAHRAILSNGRGGVLRSNTSTARATRRSRCSTGRAARFEPRPRAQQALELRRMARRCGHSRVRMGVHTGRRCRRTGDVPRPGGPPRRRGSAQRRREGRCWCPTRRFRCSRTRTKTSPGVTLAEVGERRLKDFEDPVRLHQIVDATGDGLPVGPGQDRRVWSWTTRRSSGRASG